MAKQIEGVSEKVLDCAKDEFLLKGFSDASLREIAKAADTSTSSIYTRFKDKEGLFRALVQPAADGLKNIILEIQKSCPGAEKGQLEQYIDQTQHRLLEHIYDNPDSFHLLLESSAGTEYEQFLDELVDIEVSFIDQRMAKLGFENMQNGIAVQKFVHIAATSYFNGMMEPVLHNMPKDEAQKYMCLLKDYHLAGLREIFTPV